MTQCRSKYEVLLMTQYRSKYDVLLMTQCGAYALVAPQK